MPLYDFRCSRGHTHEALAPFGALVHPCACGQLAQRVAVNRIAVVAPAPRRIDLKAALAADAEVKDAYQRHGERPPDLVREGARRAAAIRMERARR